MDGRLQIAAAHIFASSSTIRLSSAVSALPLPIQYNSEKNKGPDMNIFSRIVTTTSALLLLSPTGTFAQAPAAPGAPPVPQVRRSESTGVNLFTNNCTGCHGAVPVEHAPSEATIKTMSPERIYEAITTGVMVNNAKALSDTDKVLLAEYMGGRKLDTTDAG